MKYVGDLNNLYKDIGELPDKVKAIESLAFHTNEVLDINKLNEFAKLGVLYLDWNGVPMEGDRPLEIERSAQYMIIPTPIRDKCSDRQVCASFYKGDADGHWIGIFVGRLDKLLHKIQENYTSSNSKARKKLKAFNKNIILIGHTLKEIEEHNKALQGKVFSEYIKEIKSEWEDFGTQTSDEVTASIETEVNKDVVTTEEDDQHFVPAIILDIMNSLLLKEAWDEKGEMLYHYIGNIKIKIMSDINRGGLNNIRGNGYILNEERNMIIFNTGLINTYGKDIYLIVDIEKDRDGVHIVRTKLLPEKGTLLELGFRRQDLVDMPTPICFYKSKGDLIFDGTEDDFDFGDSFRLKHILEDRRYRFPEKYADTPDDVLADKLISSIKRAIKLSTRDYKYVIPMYNLKASEMQFLMPLYLDKSIDDTPELVLVVGKSNGFYKAYTVLDLDSAYLNARLISPLESNWLAKGREHK